MSNRPSLNGTNDLTTDEDASVVEDKTTPAWRQFELDVVTTIANLDPAAEVVHDENVKGHYSGTMRQLDAVARKSLAGAPVEVVIECKQYKRKLGIGKIDEFVGKLIDIGCAHGILYATSGVTEPARLRAHGSINPRITLRDMSDLHLYADPSQMPVDVLERILDDHAVDFSDLVEEAVLGNCQAENCWYGDVHLGSVDGILVGQCDSCGQLHVKCGCCDELSEMDWSSGVCFVCGAEYHVISYQGDLDGMEQISHGPDCNGEHPAIDTAS
ncbi:restriction endonuclease [Microbacterium profundi]|uniref:restriction endonuclease n=1 Tax=Microbacterium profundi TaxID=450380 RepID=UPI0027E1002A|nr:restriction endonuclease [Microbacterium profundi]MCE7482491.1 restriction endonuclease [Microbacterium profundi]